MTELPDYTPRAWYWIVAGDETQVWSSADRAYVPADDAEYLAFLDRGALPTRIASEAELWDVLRERAPDRLPDDAPRPVPATISLRQLALQLLVEGRGADAQALGDRGIPPGLQPVVDQMPPDQQLVVALTIKTMTEADRASPLIDVAAAAYGWTEGEADDFFRAAAQL